MKKNVKVNLKRILIKKKASVAIKSELNPENREPTDGVDSPEDET